MPKGQKTIVALLAVVAVLLAGDILLPTITVASRGDVFVSFRVWANGTIEYRFLTEDEPKPWRKLPSLD